ncbi:MAG: UDP-glucose 4-epimerase GalE [Desulfobulbaceae bacterium]|jgi:UDP-glucose 4-epimerase|nr:UDP-glucose 4-epimerase GalE [Desulfobulbaceae bacterium]
MHILVTGGAGYIGSHTCLELLQAGHQVTVVDNLVNAKEESLKRVMELTGRTLLFHQVDLGDTAALRQVFAAATTPFAAVIHFAGLKAVGESVERPLLYYQNNIGGTVSLCQVMLEFGLKRLVFSSSATVYGNPASVPITEDFPLSCTNPYGRSKLMIEDILRDLYVADHGWRLALLRYFNPVGAHKGGRIGEDPHGIPNNLMPYISQVAVGKLSQLSVYGNDYPTQDGTGVRDFIHVVDLALGHVAAIKWLTAHSGILICNLGTGRGYSVLEMIAAFEAASGQKVPYRIAPRRPGDVAACYADPSLAKRELGWSASRGIAEMCADTWRWQSMNPLGFS